MKIFLLPSKIVKYNLIDTLTRIIFEESINF